MNGVMAGMVALSVPWRQSLGALSNPGHPEFWFVMSISLTLGFAVTFPLNWWLVSTGLKHGMITVPSVQNDATEAPMRAKARPMTKAGMVVVSLATLTAGATIAGTLGSLTTR